MKILSFTISGKFAHFRKFYTTTSPLTFPFPPYTVIKGIIAAILGLERDSYNEEFNKIKIGLQINADVSKKKMFGTNYLNTKPPITFGEYIQVKRETIINPSYTIYVASSDFPLFDQLAALLKNGNYIYTPYLGVSEFLAIISNVEIGEGNLIVEKNIKIDSIFPFSYLEEGKNVNITDNQYIEFETLPFQMDNQRNIIALQKIVYNAKGEQLSLKDISQYPVYTFIDKTIVVC